MKKSKFILIILLIACLNFPLYAGDPSFSILSRAKTLSLNGLLFAGSDGLQSILGNPSLLSLLDSRYVEVYVIDRIGQQEFENRQNDLFRSFQEDDFSFGGGIYWSFTPAFSTALSYQRAIDYSVSWPFANLESDDTSSILQAFDFFNNIFVDAASASLSMHFDQIYFGGSVNLYYIKQNTAFPGTNEMWNQGQLGLPAYQFNYGQDGYAFGFNVGASFQFNHQLRLGVMVRSGYKADLEGEAKSIKFAEVDSTNSQVNLSGTFEMPWVFGGGIVYDWTETLKLNLDFQYSLWGSIQKTFDFSFNNSIWQQNLSSIDPLTGIRGNSFLLSFDNSIDAGLGLEFKLTDIILRTGYRYSQSPNIADTYNFLFPAVDQHIISIGIGYSEENLVVDAGFAYSFGVTKEVNNNSLTGNYSSGSYSPSITIKYGF